MSRFLKYFIVVASVLVLAFLIYLSFSEKIIGINKTVNWAWDFSNINFWITILTYALMFILVLGITSFLIIKIKDKVFKRIK